MQFHGLFECQSATLSLCQSARFAVCRYHTFYLRFFASSLLRMKASCSKAERARHLRLRPSFSRQAKTRIFV